MQFDRWRTFSVAFKLLFFSEAFRLLYLIFSFCTKFFVSHQVWQKRAGFNQDEIKRLRKKFAVYDDDNSGELNGAEVRKVFTDMGRVPKNSEEQRRMQAMIKNMDEDGSGSISFDEFLQLQRVLMNEDARMKLELEKEAADECGWRKH